MSGTKVYKVWVDMISRCSNPNDTGYKNWGGRGISVCEEWKKSEKFLEWAKGKWKEGLEIDRIDNNKGYSPENCWFVPKSFQTINQRNRKDSTSGYKGVNWDKQKNKWRSRIHINGKDRNLGFFSDIKDAVNARSKAVEAYKAMISAAPKE